MTKDTLYSEVRASFMDRLDIGYFPKSLLFAEGSAYISDVEDVIFSRLIPSVDALVIKQNKDKYDLAEMRRIKNRLIEIDTAMQDEDNWNICLNEWRENNVFNSYKLTE